MTIIKSQIDARKISDLDPGRLMELTETFHYMDKDKDGILNEEEFAMALKAEGVEVDDNSVGDLLQNVFKSKVVSYEAFIEFMKQEGGVLSHDQILNLFKTVSSGKVLCATFLFTIFTFTNLIYPIVITAGIRAEISERSLSFGVRNIEVRC